MSEVDVLFIVDALPETGFGHASRCLSLSRLLRRRDPDLRVAFQGVFSAPAQRLLGEYLAPGDFIEPERQVRARVAVIDRMHDIEDADSWDRGLLEKMRERSGRVVHLTSGTQDPGLPEGVVCIGFQPGGPAPRRPHLLWGLDYAPVSLALAHEIPQRRDNGRLLVALGGARDTRGIELVMGALQDLPDIRSVDVLGSPVNDLSLLDGVRAFGGDVEIHSSVPDVTPLLSRARVVLASFGHLVYEALALGTAACVIGQKRFQADYAELLAANGLAVSAGYAPEANTASVASALDRAWKEADQLSRRGREFVDGRGLDRIADMVLGIARHAA